MKKSLFSFVIGSYNNYKYIYEAIDSVLIQTYPRIELIISNDGSDDFQSDEVKRYIEKNQNGNIINLIINNNAKNIGTVANVEYCRRISNGEYIMYMAADDCLYDENVIETFVNNFQFLGDDALCITAKVAMCGELLTQIESIEPQSEVIEFIKKYTPKQMFSRLSHTFTIPTTSTCYRKKLYDIVGPYDTKYFIIEDASLYLKMSRMGIKFYWVDFIAAKHRSGGISHGNKLNLSEAYQKYRYDEILIYQNEILPYQELILDEDKKLMKKKWQYIEFAYWNDFEDKFSLKSLKYLFQKNFIFSLIKKIVFSKRIISNIFLLLIISLIVFIITDRHIFITNNEIFNTLGVLGVSISCILLFSIYFIKFIYKIKKWSE